LAERQSLVITLHLPIGEQENITSAKLDRFVVAKIFLLQQNVPAYFSTAKKDDRRFESFGRKT
jgi:hypothetical protein